MDTNTRLDLLLVGLIAFTALVGYVLYIRPSLKRNPSFGYLFASEQRVGSAIVLKVRGLKQRLFTAVLIGAAFVVQAYDFLAPVIATSGVNPAELSSKIPPGWWPWIMIAILAIVQYFRELADRSRVAPPEDPIVAAPPAPVAPVVPAAAPAAPPVAAVVPPAKK
jgi:hypothetical protein